MKTYKITSFIIGISLSTAVLTACTSQSGWYPFLYHPSFSQGNVINSNAVKELRIGMSPSQVAQLMGEPLLKTPLSPNTYRYVYTMREKNTQTDQQQIILIFKDNALLQIKK